MYDGILAETTTINGHGGDLIEAYFARPLGPGPFGSVVVIHHLPGYDAATKEIARRFAVLGYAALMPNLYSRDAPGARPDDAAALVRAQGGVPDERLVGDVGGAAASLAGAAELERESRRHRLLLGRPAVVSWRRPACRSTPQSTATAHSSSAQCPRACR